MKKTLTICFKEDSYNTMKSRSSAISTTSSAISTTSSAISTTSSAVSTMSNIKSNSRDKMLELTPFFEQEDNKSLLSTYNTMSEEEKKLYRLFKVQVDDNDLERVEAELNENPDIEFIEVHRHIEVHKPIETKYKPNDPMFKHQYSLQKIECEQAWKFSEGEGVTVAVIDTGVDYNHNDVYSNIWSNNGNYGYDFSKDNSNAYDENGHGSHVAGTIGAIANNGIGIVGVSPKVKIMPIKIFPENGLDSIVRALKCAVDNGAKVLNNSWGFTQPNPSSPTLEAAVDYVYSKGGICVFAAGNEGDDTRYYSPANYSKTITVGATDENDERPSFSNYGNEVNIYAPGKNILSLQTKTNSYEFKDGTSMAAPHVSGAIALYLSINPQASFNEVKNALIQSADRTQKGLLRLNCNKLLN